MRTSVNTATAANEGYKESLPGAYEVVQCSHGFLHRCDRIPSMCLIDINVLEAETLQAALHSRDKMLAR